MAPPKTISPYAWKSFSNTGSVSSPCSGDISSIDDDTIEAEFVEDAEYPETGESDFIGEVIDSTRVMLFQMALERFR
ncbi:MAG: hypothetical protein DDT32_00649 [Syntrophomonadaceae bacterium]|nr:hypothetical protein [Bacillota bacterium]MBT9146902.1 hypothetical protein [Bacillota bacterium]